MGGEAGGEGVGEILDLLVGPVVDVDDLSDFGGGDFDEPVVVLAEVVDVQAGLEGLFVVFDPEAVVRAVGAAGFDGVGALAVRWAGRRARGLGQQDNADDVIFVRGPLARIASAVGVEFVS